MPKQGKTNPKQTSPSVAGQAGKDLRNPQTPKKDRAPIARSQDRLTPELRTALELGAERTRRFAVEHKSHLVDFEMELVPGLVTGVKYVPVERVGAYLPAGRFPILASAFMTVNVAKVAGCETVIACTPPQADGRADPGVLYSTVISGADRIFLLGGVQALAAMTIVAEIQDFQRFAHPRQLMAYLGLIPSEPSSGSRRQGAITKAGNGPARRILVEVAWLYRYPARVTPIIARRQSELPKAITDLAWQAQVRLCARFRRLTARKLPHNKVVVAIARELVGFVWAIARAVPH